MELNDILLQIDSLKKEAENLQPVKPELERVFWDKFRLEFNYNSNHMEGNTLTYGHTQILLKSGDVVGKYNIRELQEMKAHDLALKIIRESADNPEFSLSQKLIREINEVILVEPYYNDAITQDGRPTQKLITPGEYKKTPNSVRMQNGEMFNYPSPEETPALMTDLIDWYEKETKAKELHPVQVAALFHYKIVRIHPFDDSNGRTSRLLMNYILMRNGYAPLVINSSDKKNYLIALNEADAGDIGAFVKYVTLLQLHWQGLFLKAVKGEKIEEEEDFEKEVQLLKQNISKKHDKLEATFQEASLPELFNTSIAPLINSLLSNLNKLDDFFFKKEISIVVASVGNWNKVEINNIPIIFARIEKEIQISDLLEFHYFHNNLKKAKEHKYNYETTLYIRFNELTYEIFTENIETLELKKFYHQTINADEIKTFTKSLAKKELNAIKEIIEQ